MSIYGCNMNLELQQRAVEYNAVLRKYEQLRDGLFEQMPAVELKSSSGAYANTSASNLDENDLLGGGAGGGEDVPHNEEDRRREQERAKEEAAKTLIDIFNDDTFGSSSPPPVPVTTSNQNAGANDIFKMLDQPAVTQTTTTIKNPIQDLDSLFTGTPKTTTTTTNAGLDDLLGLGGGSSAATASNSHHATHQQPTNDLLGLFAGGSVAPAAATTSPSLTNGALANLMGVSSSKTSSFTAYEKNDIKIVFETAPGKPSSLEQCFVQVKVDNLSITNFVKDFEFSAAVPKTMQIQITPPTSNVMQPLDSLALLLAIVNPKKVISHTFTRFLFL